MVEKLFDYPVRILLDENGDVYNCSSMKKGLYTSLIEQLNILKKMEKVEKHTEIYKDYLIYIEKIVLMDKLFYLMYLESVRGTGNSSLDHIVYKDYQTGIYNRNYWENLKIGNIKISNLSRYSIAFIDIDNLKEINDRYDHIKGDAVVKIVADAIKESIRKADVAVRYGGDEFVILFPNTNERIASLIINKIKQNVTKESKSKNLIVRISSGIDFSDDVSTLERTMQKADNKMYQEKVNKKKRTNNRRSDKSRRGVRIINIKQTKNFF
jgi:diguanylate cyclase (GGDEF)-like protein